ncbi:hypothetical protein [Streptomyces sp. NPDC006551]|uniref:hypothetical protein n=1 Tax=Streptomyces sp. NPDC006551 TaxID=3157178 RepID=UPI0033B99235
MTQPTPPAPFGADGCQCSPLARDEDGGTRYLWGNETDDMIVGWERNQNCPHHARSVLDPDRLARYTRAVEKIVGIPSESYVEPFMAVADAEQADLRQQLQEAEAALAAHLNAPQLRRCLVPGCLREFDFMARMAGEPPARSSWSGDGWRQLGNGSIHPRGGRYFCPDHTDLVTAHAPRRVETVSGRWTVDCACGWMATPQRWHGLVAALWEEHLLTVKGDLPPAPPLTDPEHRIPLADHTEQSLAELYDRLWDAEADGTEAREIARASLLAYSQAVPALLGAKTSLEALRQRITLDSRDWTQDKTDAWLWAILVGANCENTDPDHTHDDIDCAGDQGLWNLGRQHDIPTDQVIRAGHLRWWIANAIRTAQQIEEGAP